MPDLKTKNPWSTVSFSFKKMLIQFLLFFMLLTQTRDFILAVTPSFCQEALVIFGFSLKSETFPSCGLELMVLNTWWAFHEYILNAFLLEFFPGLDSYT